MLQSPVCVFIYHYTISSAALEILSWRQPVCSW